MRIGEAMNAFRTWSAVHRWGEENPGRKSREEGGEGDVMDEIFDEVRETEGEWKADEAWLERNVEMDWGTGLVIARRK